jgi:hypothetical protein
MMVIIAGMRHSASTLLFNAARLMMREHLTDDVVQCCFEDRIEKIAYQCRRGLPRHWLVKTHRYFPHLVAGADMILTSHRDLRDVAAAAIRRERVENNTRAIVAYLDRHVTELEKWEWIETGDFEYSNMINHGDICAQALATDLFASDYDTGWAQQKWDEAKVLQPPKESIDPLTLLTAGHFTGVGIGGYSNVISADTSRIISVVFAKWQKDHGYG